MINTINKEMEINGISLMSAKDSTVKILPSEKKGIYFFPNNSREPVKACLQNVVSTQHCTVIGNNNATVALVEHFMAACAFANISALEVCMNSSEMPILDGSAKVWIEHLKNISPSKSFENSKRINFDKPLYLSSSSKTNIVLLPCDKFKISYCVNFNHPDLERKWFSWELGNPEKEIIEARTFGYLKDLENLQKAGFSLGVKIDNTLGLTQDGYTTRLRSVDEPIKHKILDFIGDLYLTGVNTLGLNAHFIVQEAGHKDHVMFANILSSALENRE